MHPDDIDAGKEPVQRLGKKGSTWGTLKMMSKLAVKASQQALEAAKAGVSAAGEYYKYYGQVIELVSGLRRTVGGALRCDEVVWFFV